jgi:NAD(P)H-nitrite reductase large subunit
MRHVIIGSGVAGIAAVESIRSVERGAEIIMLGDDPHGFYSRPGLAYYLTGEVSDQALYPKTREDYKKLGFTYRKARVTKILRDETSLQLDDNSLLTYDRLLLATGAFATPLAVSGAALQGVVKLGHLNDARAILKLANRGRTAVVVGGGITALELFEAGRS